MGEGNEGIRASDFIIWTKSMKYKYATVGLAQLPKSDYWSFAEFEATIQNAGQEVLNIAILGLKKEIQEEFVKFVKGGLYDSLSTNLLAITEGGDVLARYIEPEWIFSEDRLDAAFQKSPLEIESVKSIAEVFANPIQETPEEEKIELRVRAIVRESMARLAKIIAENPLALYSIEWRELEKIMAEVFSGIGFEVELTPPSKDKGRDIILNLKLNDGERSYLVELKHWLSESKVGGKPVRQFVNVVVNESRSGGIFLSTLGYTKNAFHAITEVERRKVKFGDKEKIVSLCRTYEKSQFGITIPKDHLPALLLEVP
jgi:restriction endonuclease Mrr